MNWKPYSLTLFFLLAGFSAAAQDEAGTYSDFIKKAHISHRERNYGEALKQSELARKATTNPKEISQVSSLKFSLLLALNDLPAASAFLEKDLLKQNLTPKEKSNLLIQLGRAWQNAKDFEQARKFLAQGSTVPGLDVQAKFNAQYAFADSYWIQKKWESAAREFLKILEEKDLSAQNRLSLVVALTDKCYAKTNQFAEIDALLTNQLTDASLNNAQKFLLIRKLSENQFTQWKFKDALVTLDTLWELPGLSDAETVEILRTKAQYYGKLGDYARAAGELLKVANDNKLNTQTRIHVAREAKKYLMDDYRLEDALALMDSMRKLPDLTPEPNALITLEYADVLLKGKEYAQARKLLLDVLACKELKGKERSQAKTALIAADLGTDDLSMAKSDLDQYILTEKDNANDEILCQYAARLTGRQKFREALPYLKAIQNPKRGMGGWGSKSVVWTYFRALKLGTSNAEFVAGVKEMAERSVVNPQERATYRLIAAIAESGDAVKSVKDFLGAKEFSSKVEADLLSFAGKFYVSVGENQIAREINRQRESLFQPVPRNELKIEYVKNAPTDVGSWLNSDLIKDAANRAEVNNVYGEKEAANLVTDVMAQGRVVGDSSVQTDKETYFYVCYDEYAVHLFFVGVDSKVNEIMKHRLGGSGYEMYLAIGEGAPAYQWLFDQPGEKLYIPPWNSPHKFYRNLGEYVKLKTTPVSNGIASVMSFSWELAYDRLPENGDTWPFELIRWTRGGGVTWGGKSVWQIGNWGRLKFDGMTPDVQTRIKSNLIYKSYAKYKKQSNAQTGGLIALWQDAELGDPEFYRTSMAPLVKRLNEYGTLVTDQMSPETVKILFAEAVPHWFDFEYTVAELRKNYLMKRATVVEKK